MGSATWLRICVRVEIRTPILFDLDRAPRSARRLRRSRLLACLAAATLAVSCATQPVSDRPLAASPQVAAPPPARTSPLRPPILGRSAGVSAGHPLTTAAAIEVLQKGGNAFDAGVAALLVGAVVEQDLYSIGGEALILVYSQAEGKVTSINGQGWAPAAASIDEYLRRGKTLQGAGLDPAVVPGAAHAALTVLERWGTMSFEQVAARAIEYAELGFPLRDRTADAIRRERGFIDRWPDNRRYWLKPDGSFYRAGETLRLPTLAATFRRMIDAERAASAAGREAGIKAARDRFYRGDIADEMVEFLRGHDAPFEKADFSEFYARVEDPVATTYNGYTIYKQPFNSQGPTLLQALNILENFDLPAMGRNSADYLHVMIEALKLAYADRDTYYADEDFVAVPREGLLSKEYARRRAAEIDMAQSALTARAGDPLPFDTRVDRWDYWIAGRNDAPGESLAAVDDSGSWKDTTHIAIIDKDDNVFDSTPSGGWIGGAVILGETGVGMSVRGEQFWLDKTKAAQLRPRSRPRYTLTPTIVMRDDRPFLAIGSPGGDNQEQTILQTFLAVVNFWDDWYPNLHKAIEWPRAQTLHFYASFWPHPIGANRLNVEADVAAGVVEELRRRGHDVNVVRPLSLSGCATAVLLDPASGNRIAAGDPRRDCYASAY